MLGITTFLSLIPENEQQYWELNHISLLLLNMSFIIKVLMAELHPSRVEQMKVKIAVSGYMLPLQL